MASDEETVQDYISGDDEDIPTDEDSAGSLREFIVNSDDESEGSEADCESGGSEDLEREDQADVEVEGHMPDWIDEKNIVEGGRARRRRTAQRYEDENYRKLMISDSEASFSSSCAASEDESDDTDFQYESDESVRYQ